MAEGHSLDDDTLSCSSDSMEDVQDILAGCVREVMVFGPKVRFRIFENSAEFLSQVNLPGIDRIMYLEWQHAAENSSPQVGFWGAIVFICILVRRVLQRKATKMGAFDDKDIAAISSV